MLPDFNVHHDATIVKFQEIINFQSTWSRKDNIKAT